MSELYMVDADGHVIEPIDMWTSRMSLEKWGDWIPRYVAADPDADQEESWYFAGVRRAGGKGSLILACSAGMDAEQIARDHPLLMEGRRGAWDPDARVAELDDEGIDAAVLYPSLTMFFGPSDPIEGLRNIEFVLDCQRAYNDWLAEYCRAHPDRLFGVAAVPLQDVELAVAEAGRAAELGLKGLFLRPSAYLDELPFSHHRYDRFWAACQDLDIPIAFHPVVHVDTPGAARYFRLVRGDENISINNLVTDEIYGGAALGQAVGNTVDMIVTVGRLLMGGVCERFPRLKFLFLESGGGWLPNVLERMDDQVKAFPSEARWLSLLPTEYFKRQCWISFEPNEDTLPLLAETIGVDRIIWASDYPHADAPYPGAPRRLLENLSALSIEAQSLIAGQNAALAYKLPIKATA
jgi:predicted TIM-barrel fold metal-dependent hydrolase